jgi:ABC-2 type transport system permease protein
MKGWTSLIRKDWKLIFRNRLLIVVLVLYPFLIMGVIGAAFYDAGRPVPIGLVNLDRIEQGRLAWIGADLEGGWLEAQSLLRTGSTVTYGSREEAVAELQAGTVDLVALVAGQGGERQWTGRQLSRDAIEQLFSRVSATLSDYSSVDDGLEAIDEGKNNLLMALREEDYPSLGESLWLDGQSYDSSSLVKRFSEDVTETIEYPSEDEAREALKKGRVDAVIVLPRGFVHDLKALDKVASLRVTLDQSNMVKAEFAETNIRGFLARINEGVVKSKMTAVIAGLYSLVGGGDFFGTQITGLQQIRDNLEKIKQALTGNSELQSSVDTGIELADTVINDIEDAMAYLRGTALPIQLDISSVAGRPLSTKDAVVPSLIALSILWTGVLCGAILMVSEEEEGMSQRLRLTDAGPLAVPASKVLLATAVVFTQSIAMLVIAVAILGAFASHIPLALLVIAVACFSCIGIGLLIAAFARQVTGAVILSVLVTFPLIFMTGAVFPLSQMPSFMQWLARAVPVTYAIEALSGVMLRAETIADVAWEIGVLIAFGVALIGLSAVLLRRRSA